MYGRLVRGVVDDALPAGNVYIVRVPKEGRSFHCVSLVAAANPFGAKSIGMYPPGSPVVCAIWESGPGIILGSQSQHLVNPSLGRSHLIAPLFSGVHAYSDDIDSYIPLHAPANIDSFAVGQPLDTIPGHDHGAMQDLGTGYGVGLMEAWLRASELAGLWCYYQDNLTRLASYNFDHWTCGGERWIRNDQGEVNDVDGMSPYPWEAMGAWAAGDDVFKTNQGGGDIKPGAVAKHEPVKPDQCGIYRHRILRGYIADMYKHEVILPKLHGMAQLAGTNGNVAALSDPEAFNFSGLSSVQEHADGLYSIRSAKGIVLEKYLFIPVARQTAVPEQGKDLGDTTPANYAAAGKAGANADKHDRKTIMVPDDAGRPDMWIGQLFDIHAYVFNWWSQRGMRVHEKDWKLPEEGHFAQYESEPGAASWFGGVYVPKGNGTASPLADEYVLGVPDYFDVEIDHTTKSRYYCSRSIIEQMPDGSIVIEDGYGSGIYLSQGNIRFTCAGDELHQPGRSFIAMAGDDAVVRAGSSVDVTAALGDVRLKAERNLHALAGNGQIGGVLIESRSRPIERPQDWLRDRKGEAAVTAGIVFHAPSGSPVLFRASDIRFRAEGVDGNAGTMMFEAPAGGINMEAAFFNRNCTNSALGYADYAGGSPVLVYGYERMVCNASKSVVFTTPDVGVSHDLFAGGKIAANDGVVPVDNSAAILSALRSNGEAWISAMPGAESVTQYFTAARERSEWLLSARFTCRTPEQYGTQTQGFYLVEARWQRAYRERGIGTGLTEPLIADVYTGKPEDATAPYPGRAAWQDDKRYRLVDSKLFDWAARRAKDRSTSEYAAGGPISKLMPVTLSGSYLVSRQEVAQEVT